jgi:MSHA biogenesis protein MshM
MSGGVPRLINILAHKCLMLAYGEGVHRITAAHLRLAAKDTPGIVVRSRWAGFWARWNKRWAAKRKTPARGSVDSTQRGAS